MSLTIEVYSEKAIVLRGAQESHHAVLEANKGMYNARLKGGAGWIFPKFMKSQIDSLVEQINSGVDLTPPPRAAKASSSSAEPEVTKKEYLAVVSRVERLEALIAQLLKGSVPSSSSSSSSVEIRPTPPSLDQIPVEDIDIDFEMEEEETPVKKLSKPSRAAVSKVPTVASVSAVSTTRRSFSKPKVNP